MLFCLNSGFSLAKFLGGDVAVQALTIESDELFSSADIEEVAASCVQKMRAIQPAGPYAICGYSVYGILAYEMAVQLSRQGEELRLLALLDTTLARSQSDSVLRRLANSLRDCLTMDGSCSRRRRGNAGTTFKLSGDPRSGRLHPRSGPVKPHHGFNWSGWRGVTVLSPIPAWSRSTSRNESPTPDGKGIWRPGRRWPGVVLNRFAYQATTIP